MVSVLVWSVLDHGFHSQLGQIIQHGIFVLLLLQVI